MTVAQIEMFEDDDVLFPVINQVTFDEYQQAVLDFYDAQEEMREIIRAEPTPAEITMQDLIEAYDRAKRGR